MVTMMPSVVSSFVVSCLFAIAAEQKTLAPLLLLRKIKSEKRKKKILGRQLIDSIPKT